MSYVNKPDYPVNFSLNIGEIKSSCPDMLTEGQVVLFTENGLIIEQDCIPDRYACSGSCAREESSGSFTITNTCALPMTITGFVLEDPDNFSIFKSSYYTDSYVPEFVEELPVTIQPYSSLDVPTFFKPTITELENADGERPTFENRVGTKITSKLEIYPGFPVFNLSNSSYCDTSITLSGEFICEDKEKYDYEWTGNYEHFIPVKINNLKAFNLRKYYNKYNLKRTMVFNSTSKALLDAICEYILYLNDNNWFSRMSANWAIIATLEAVKNYLKKYPGVGSPAKVQSKFISSYWISPINPISSSSFGPESIVSNFDLNGESYLGVKVNTESTNLPKGFIRDQILFFTDPKKNKKIKLFLCDNGNINTAEIVPIEWKDGYTPSTPDGVSYNVSPKMSLSNNKIIENSELGATIGKITAEVR